MRRLCIGAALTVAVFAAGCAWRARAREKREEKYSEALRSYADVLKPGVSRKDVEAYLGGKSIKFGRICCMDGSHVFADTIEIGKEHAPWFCEAHHVYVAFEFTASNPQEKLEGSESDVLRSVTIFHHLDGCL